MGPISLLHKMVKLPTVKRLAADIFKCGTNRIWLDPNETAELSLANSRAAVRRLQKKGFILKKPTNNVSRARIRKRNKMRRLGRYRGFGRRRGYQERALPAEAPLDAPPACPPSSPFQVPCSWRDRQPPVFHLQHHIHHQKFVHFHIVGIH